MAKIEIIEGEVFNDHRGQIRSLNNWKLDGVRRTYTIIHPDDSVMRGWHGHQHERKWFYCVKGSWRCAFVEIDDWDNPSPSLKPTVVELSENDSRLVCVPAGYANMMKALQPDSILQVFSDVPLPEAYADSWRYPAELWTEGIF